MIMTRRVLLAGASAAALGACAGKTDFASIQEQWNQFVDRVQAQMAKGCAVGLPYIPTVETIAAAVAALWGPAAIATAGSIFNSVAAVVNVLCGAAAPALQGKLRASTPGAPVYIGDVTVNGNVVHVHGFNAHLLSGAGRSRASHGDVRKLIATMTRRYGR